MPPTADMLDAIEIAPKGRATHSILWLHGLGDTGHGHVDVVRSLALPAGVAPRFILPHAPQIPVTINMGMVMPAWYDIESLEGRRHDLAGVRRSAERVAALVEREIERGVPAEKIVLAGFSQGGVIAFHLATRYPKTLAGAIGLSTYIVGAETLEAEASAANRSLPVFQAHGTVDPMIPIAGARRARDLLMALGHEVEWHEYPMQHEISLEEIEDVSAWLGKRLLAG